MEQLDDCCHRHQCTSIQKESYVPTSSFKSLDTVRALHQTVVALRQALENANREISTLKKQIIVKDDIEEGKKYRSASIEIPPSSRGDKNQSDKSIKVIDDDNDTLHHSPTSINNENRSDFRESAHNIQFHENIPNNHKHHFTKEVRPIETDIEIKATEKASGSKCLQMASRIDVKIKLVSNVQIDDIESSSEATGDSNSETLTPRESSLNNAGNEEANLSSEIKEETNKTVTDDDREINGSKQTDENIQDDIEIKEIVEEEDGAVGGIDDSEGLDDIELIFSSDDKEYPQEDLVSISYYEPWQLTGQSGTPILVNFNSISSEVDGAVSSAGGINLSASPSPIDPYQFYNDIKENFQTHQFSLESSDSLSLGGNTKRCYDFQIRSSHSGKSDDRIDENELKKDESFGRSEQTGKSLAMGRRWTNYNVLQETDISKIGVIEEDVQDKMRRNTCPNPTVYRPIIHREALGRFLNMGNNNASMVRNPLAVKFAPSARKHLTVMNNNRLNENDEIGPKRTSSAQTDISALPEHWRSESHLMAGILGNGFFTLPSKYVTTPGSNTHKHPLKVSEKTREARRVLLSDINFTSMVPELSRSADHLCHGEDQQNIENNNAGIENYSKEQLFKTPDFMNRGITPSMSLTSAGVSQWTVNENSTQTDNQWSAQHGDSFDSCRSFSNGSKLSLVKHNRSRSCPSVRCALCKHRHHGGIKMSESMNYAPRVTFQEPRTNTVRGSLPDLSYCACGCLRSRYATRTALHYGDSCGSTDSILDEADDFLSESIDGVLLQDTEATNTFEAGSKTTIRRCSENDLNSNDFCPSKQSSPFLPSSTKCLKPGYLAKVITKNGRLVMGRIRYVGPLVSTNNASSSRANENDIFVGLQLSSKIGECNGSFEGRKIFDCEPRHGIFVPFKKVVMAWKS